MANRPSLMCERKVDGRRCLWTCKGGILLRASCRGGIPLHGATDGDGIDDLPPPGSFVVRACSSTMACPP
jgi:hypothetical protein